jgi:hypothetical protein
LFFSGADSRRGEIHIPAGECENGSSALKLRAAEKQKGRSSRERVFYKHVIPSGISKQFDLGANSQVDRAT